MDEIQALRELYQAHHNQFAQMVDRFPAAGGPLLLQPIEYFQQPTKLFIIGQETYGWDRAYPGLDERLGDYRRFNVGKTYPPSPFWNVTRKVESILRIAQYSCAWSNLNRFDNGRDAPTGAFLDEVSKFDFLVREEIQILQPDVCIFYTNRKYDYRLSSLYPDLELHEISALPHDHFVRLVHRQLPALTFRTPHPRTMRSRGWEAPFLAFVSQLALN